MKEIFYKVFFVKDEFEYPVFVCCAPSVSLNRVVSKARSKFRRMTSLPCFGHDVDQFSFKSLEVI